MDGEGIRDIQSQEDDDELDEDRSSGPVIRMLNKHREAYPSLAAAFSAVSVGALVSWASGASNGLIENLTGAPYGVTNHQFSLGIVLLPAGAALGAISSGAFAQSLGRKLALQCMALPCILSWVMLLLGNSYWWFYVARVFGGVAMGIVYTTAIIYIAEICPPSVRGVYCAFVQICFSCGVLYTCLINVFVKHDKFYPVTAACLPVPFIATLLMQLAPETPQFYVHTHQYVKAVKSLQRLRGIEVDIEDEFEELKSAEEDDIRQSIFKQKTTRKAFYITTGVMAFHHLSGIYGVIMRLEKIAEDIGVFTESVTALIIAIVMLLSACVAAGIVDRVGRKILLYISLGTMSAMAFVQLVCLIVLFFMKFYAVKWISFLCLMMYACAFNLGVGPLPWVIMGEVIPQHFRGSVCGMVSAAGWILCTLTNASYAFIPSIIANCALHLFFCLLGVVFIRKVVPETRGYTLDEIHAFLQR